MNNISDLTEEVAANAAESLMKSESFVEDLFTDKDFIEHIVKTKSKSFVQRVMERLRSIISAVKQYLSNANPNHDVAKALIEDVNELEKVEKLWVNAFKTAAGNRAEVKSSAKENTDTESSGVRYSLKEYTEHQKENWKDSKQIIIYENEIQLRDFIQKSLNGECLSEKKKMYFGAVSSELAERIYNETGIETENYNITISSNEIRKILLNSHGDEKTENLRGQRAITVDDILSIPRIIEEADSIELDKKTYAGKPIIRFVKTFNGKTTAVSYVSQKRHDLGVQTMYSGIKKDSLVTAANAKAFTETSETTSNTAIFDTNISQNDTDVNSSIREKGGNDTKFSLPEIDSNGNKLSEQQREYFKDSKVVDENGNLLVVYHQTDSDFTVFDTHHKGAGSYDYETPYGVFLKPTNENIGVNGSKQMQLYANITNPLIVSDRAKMSQYLKKNIQYAEYITKIDEANKTFKANSDDAINAFKDYLIAWRRENPKAKSSEIYNDEKFNELFEAEDRISSEWSNTINDLSQQAKSLINDILTADGYDGVIINHDAGSFGRSVKSIIALENTQVKNVDNESPTTNEDIRFSIPEQTSAEYELLLDKNEDLRKQVEALKSEMKLTKGHKVNPEAVKKLTNKILREYSSKADKEEISARLEQIFNFVASENVQISYTITFTLKQKSSVQK